MIFKNLKNLGQPEKSLFFTEETPIVPDTARYKSTVTAFRTWFAKFIDSRSSFNLTIDLGLENIGGQGRGR